MATRVITLPENQPEKRKAERINSDWWTQPGPKGRGAAAWEVCHRLAMDSKCQLRHREWLAYARLYCNQPIDTLRGARIVSQSVVGAKPKLTFNGIQSVVDTVSARIAKNKPRMTCLTQGGDYQMKLRGKKLTKFIDGIFDAGEVYQETRRVFADSEIFGTGFSHPYCDSDGKICVERVLPFEVVIDEVEGIYGKPRTMYRLKPVHRDVLAASFSDVEGAKSAIERAPGVDESGGESIKSDVIQIVEAWHLGSGKECGRHVIGIDGFTLEDEEWEYKYLPLIPLKWNQKPWGYWGQGLPELLAGLQFEVNALLETIQAAQGLMGVPRVLIPIGSNITKSHINNLVGALLYYTGDKAPTFHTAQAVHPELYQHLERLYQRMFELSGVSQLSATGVKPAGLDAAVALREYHDIESERFVIAGQVFEEHHRLIALQCIDLAKEHYGKGTSVMVPGRKFIESIKWSDVNMEQDQYSLRVFPSSILPTTPSGRLNTVQELIQSGMIDTDVGYSLLDWPDLDSAANVRLAGMRDIERVLDKILEEGEYEPPDEFMDLQRAPKMAHSALINARIDGAPDDRLELLTRWIEELKFLGQTAAPPAPAAAPIQQVDPSQLGVAPMGAPALPSDLATVPMQ